jgi:chemosensory pili system protein ChpA (sensor histidine kinase/response regulator)
VADTLDNKPTDDLSALAWVQNELRRSLENAHKALRRYLKESESATRSDLDTVDPAALRTARTQMHQGVGALELVGLPAAARLLRASEAAVQRMLSTSRRWWTKPRCTPSSVRRSRCWTTWRGCWPASRSPVSLFPQYQAVQALAGADRVHPADLWEADFAWHDLPDEPGVVPRAADDASRGTHGSHRAAPDAARRCPPGRGCRPVRRAVGRRPRPRPRAVEAGRRLCRGRGRRPAAAG